GRRGGDDGRGEDGGGGDDQPLTRPSLAVRSVHENLLVAFSGHGRKLWRRVRCSLRGDPSCGSGHALPSRVPPEQRLRVDYSAWSAIAPSRTRRRTSSAP